MYNAVEEQTKQWLEKTRKMQLKTRHGQENTRKMQLKTRHGQEKTRKMQFKQTQARSGESEDKFSYIIFQQLFFHSTM